MGNVRKISNRDDERLKILLCQENISPNYTYSVVTDEYFFPPELILMPAAAHSLHFENAGGKSNVSEALSMHYLELLYDAHDIIFEMEVEYWIRYSMVDYICTIGDHRIGVSVTRAMGKFPKKRTKGGPSVPLTIEDVPDPSFFTIKKTEELLHKKLYGLIVSRNAVCDKHSFFRSILHIWCQTQEIADMLRGVFETYDMNDFGLEVQGTIILLLTVCDHPSIYTNKLLH